MLLLCGLPRLYADGVIYQINCGGPAAFPAVPTGFACDAYGSGGDKYSTSTTVDTSAVVGPAPQSAYQMERYGQVFSYSFPGLLGGASYAVRLHFAEYRYGATGYNNKPARLFNVSINSQTVLSNFDVYATAGAKYKAIIENFSTTADSNGKITINFSGGTDNAEVKAIEVLGQQVRVDVNNTSKTTDDIVRLTSDTPVRKFTTPCTIQTLGTQSADLNVFLSCSNGAGRVGFDTQASAGSETSTLNLTLPKDGTPVKFYIVGDSKSTAIGDADIQVTNSVNNQIYGVQPTTVFWFGSPLMQTTSGNSYSYSSADATFMARPIPAINLLGQTNLMPAGLDLTSSQIKNLELGIEQNFVSAIYRTIFRIDLSTVNRNPDTPGTSGNVPTSFSRTATIPNCVDTIDPPTNEPLYDPSDTALHPFSSVGTTKNQSSDTPRSRVPASPSGNLIEPVYDDAGDLIATVGYIPTISINATFRDWLVVYDPDAPVGQRTQRLAETGWLDDVSNASGSNTNAMPTNANLVPPQALDTPIEIGKTGNQYLADPVSLVYSSNMTTITNP